MDNDFEKGQKWLRKIFAKFSFICIGKRNKLLWKKAGYKIVCTKLCWKLEKIKKKLQKLAFKISEAFDL